MRTFAWLIREDAGVSLNTTMNIFPEFAPAEAPLGVCWTWPVVGVACRKIGEPVRGNDKKTSRDFRGIIVFCKRYYESILL